MYPNNGAMLHPINLLYYFEALTKRIWSPFM